MKNNIHLVILAGGNATRMLPIHQNCYPKILVNLGNEIQIKKMLDSFPDVSKRTILVGSQKQRLQVNDMLNILNINGVNVHQITCGSIGTLASIRNAVALHFDMESCKNVLLSWSDICPVEQPIFSSTNTNIIFTDIQKRHRMNFDGSKISFNKNLKGNLPGLFFIKDLHSLVGRMYDYEDNKTTDFVEVLMNEKIEARQIELGFVDTGDVAKYEKYLHTVDIKQRFFNSVSINDTTVTKTATNSKGVEVLSHEKSFYEVQQSSNFPKLITSTNNSITIERIQGVTIHEYIKSIDSNYVDSNVAINLYNKFTEAIKNIHSTIQTNTIKEAFINEYINIPLNRYNEIKNILPTISNVNGIEVNHGNVATIINKVGELLANVDEVSLIHGDTNTSNVLIENNSLKFIDPRGQFGGNKFYGDKQYDHAKFLYGLSGYDHFNLTKDIRFNYDTTTNELFYNCIDGYNLDTLTDDVVLKYLVGLIWFKLPLYTINNINKAIVSYGHGLSLITKYGQQVINKLS